MRARNIKPGFFQNEVLAALPFEFRLLFIGTWMIADREGRFEDRPSRIKMQLFPADNVDVEAGLQALHDHGLILRYDVERTRYCLIPAFRKHQHPHVKEAVSTIPAPGEHRASTVQEQCESGTSSVQAQEEHQTSPAESLLLNPDVLNTDLVPRKTSRKKKSALPPDFQPNDNHRDLARALGLNLDAQLESFRDYHLANGSTFIDWNAALRTWLRKAKEFKPASRQNTSDLGDLYDSTGTSKFAKSSVRQ